MLFWWPLVKDLDIPMPRTYIIGMSLSSDKPTRAMKYLSEIRHAVKFCGGYPIFMRTDLMSAKFDWSKTCYCAGEQELIANIPRLAEVSETCDMIGRPVSALIFREYIEMVSGFKAFGGLPISRERRYFVRDGQVICHHAYWPRDAIRFYSPQFKNPEWETRLANLNVEHDDEIKLLTKYAEIIGSALPGYWSVDFCNARPQRNKPRWYFIDCALGENSWHPECTEKELE